MFTRELVGKVVCSSYVAHQKPIRYSWILAITRAYSPLKSTNSTTAFNRQKLSWNLSISLVSDPTRSWILFWSQFFAGWSSITRWPRMSFGTIVNRSQVTLECFISCKLCRVRQVTRGGRAQVVGRSLIGRKASQISRRSVASVSQQSGHGCGSKARVYADRLMNGVRGSQARNSIVVRSQVTIITWPSIHILFLVCQSLPDIDVIASLRPDDRS